VQYLGDQARVTVNLVDTDAERQLRSTVIDDYHADFSSLQDSIVLELAAMLEVELDRSSRELLTAGRTSMQEAYDLYLQGHGYIQGFERIGELDTAIALFRQAVTIDPDYGRGWIGLGEAYWTKFTMNRDAQLIDSAEESSRRALALDDRLSGPHINLGFIYTGTGRHEEAIAEFDLALKLDPLSHRAYGGLARAYEASNDMERAEATYKKVIELKPDYWLGYRDLQLFYLSQGRHDEALQYLDEAVALNLEGFSYWNDLGALYYFLNRYSEARDMWKRSLGIAPNYPAYSNLGSLNYMAGRFPEAAQMYAGALDLDSSDYRVWMNLASALYWSPGERDKGLAAYGRAVSMAEEMRKVNPRDPDVLCNLAECYAALGDGDHAHPLLEQALELAPQNVDIMMRAGIVHEQLGERDAALTWIEKTLAQGYPIAQIESLPDLSELCADPRFTEIRERIEGPADKKSDSTAIDD
jgi:tetratricopeptide (TPR) repeat protein